MYTVWDYAFPFDGVGVVTDDCLKIISCTDKPLVFADVFAQLKTHKKRRKFT